MKVKIKKEGKVGDNKGKPFEKEQDIFKFLGIKYVEPEDRKGGIIKDNLINDQEVSNHPQKS